jgi:GxxExxY protein
MDELIYKQEAYIIIGCAMEVHKYLGRGFSEAVYQEAFEYELNEAKILYYREKELYIQYKDILLQKKYIADFMCFDKIIVELKAVSCLEGFHEAQIINYLKVTGFKLGLLINFGEDSLVYKRFVLSSANSVR